MSDKFASSFVIYFGPLLKTEADEIPLESSEGVKGDDEKNDDYVEGNWDFWTILDFSSVKIMTYFI